MQEVNNAVTDIARSVRCCFLLYHFDILLSIPGHCQSNQINYDFNDTIRYDTRCYFNVRSKADISQLNLPHGTDN